MLKTLTFIMETFIWNITTFANSARTIFIPPILIGKNEFFLQLFFSKIESYIDRNSIKIRINTIVPFSCCKKNLRLSYKRV